MAHTERTKQKIREARKRFFLNGGKAPNQGIPHSKETREKISNALRKENHPFWSGGKTISSQGYIMIRFDGHPFATKKGSYVAEHRLVMEKKIGRILKQNEVVHHLNGNRQDNRVSNLVITNSSNHVSEHNRARVWKEESKEKHRAKAARLNRNLNGQFTT